MRLTLSSFVLLASLSACQLPDKAVPAEGRPSASQTVTLRGTVAYPQRIALPRDARLEVSISDVSRADAMAPIVAQLEMETAGRQVPLSFALDYDRAAISARGRYSVAARITDVTGRLLWITDTHVDLPPPGASVELTLVQVPRN